MNCRSCGREAFVTRTKKSARVEIRIRGCECGDIWETTERETPGTRHRKAPGAPPDGARSATNSNPVATRSQPLSSESDLKSLQVPELLIPKASLLSEPRARARIKPAANEHQREMIAEFVDQWQAAYGERYPIVTKDAAQLSAMAAKNPQLIGRWPEMVRRYLTSGPFWAQKRHPLWGLVTNPVEFAGETNGAPSLSRATVGTVNGLGRFIANGKGAK